MASQMDARQSFEYLVENIPQWLTRLDDLLAKCEAQYERFTRMTQRGPVKLTRRKKAASVESLRPVKDEGPMPQLTASAEQYTPTSPLPQSQAQANPPAPKILASQEIPRKRRAGSELSEDFSGQCNFRTKHMVVVYYDSEIQEAFESLVKKIATARNNLRKGKNATSFQIRMSSMGLNNTSFEKPSEKPDLLELDSKMLITPGSGRLRHTRQSKDSELKFFEDADHELDCAQSFCERGAHQFLRDGDSHSEIQGTRKCFQKCAMVAQNGIEKLKDISHRESEIAMDQEEAAEEETLVGESTANAMDKSSKLMEVTPPTTIKPPSLKEVKLAGTGAIEIDDDSDVESIKIDINAIRRTVRSTRV